MKKVQEKVRIIVDSSDASKDQHVAAEELQGLAAAGRIVRDLTNGGWCTPNGKPL